MFQTFDATTSPHQGPPRLDRLRAWMSEHDLDGFLVPRADKHQGEYVAPCDERLAWLTGFTGSAGFACVLQGVAGVFIDGRYRLQVQDQTADVFTPVPWPETSLADWLRETAPAGARIGFDPWLHTVAQLEATQKALDGSGIELVAADNGVDAIWTDRPAPPKGKVWAHDVSLAGQTSGDKRALIGAAVAERDCDAAVLTLPDSICWLLNIRGADIPRTPVVQAFATITANGRVALFSDQDKFADLGPDPAIDQHDWAAFSAHLTSLGGRVLVDPASLPAAAMAALQAGPADVVHGQDPCTLPKARKNAVELAGARAAHETDAVAFTEFLAWFDAQDHSGLTEIDVVTALEDHRRRHGNIHDISFETICGSGPNGAIVHYRVTNGTNRPLDADSLLLIDSGAQYPQGTTDITRVLPLGTPSARMKQVFTAVLRGMIAVSMLRFPQGLAGQHIDAFARAPLWDLGLDFDHGTGHGVGSFLSVHEGPQRISRISDVAFEPGMIVSNEPGYYKAGDYGIRIENLIAVRKARPHQDGDDGRAMLEFETLTLAPIDRRLIVADTLAPAERDWLNAYHARVQETLHPHLSQSARVWLNDATRPI